MRVIELDRSYCRKYYNGSYRVMIELEDGIIFTEEIIRRAFNFGHGTIEDFKKHMKNNLCYCKYYDLDNMEFI